MANFDYPYRYEVTDPSAPDFQILSGAFAANYQIVTPGSFNVGQEYNINANVGLGGDFVYGGYTIGGGVIVAEMTNKGVPTGNYYLYTNDPSLQPTTPSNPAPTPANTGNIADLTSFACFLAGTMIATLDGARAVEDLAVGDVVVTRFGGCRPVKWVSFQRLQAELLGERHAPVRIKAGALGPNQPMRDLLVSPEHAILIDDCLVTAKLLVNDVTVLQEPMAGEIVYYHVDLGAHDVLMAEGAWAESYREAENRHVAHNYDDYLKRYPDHVPTVWEPRLPVIGNNEDPRLPALRQKIMDNIPTEAFVEEPDLHILANGRRLDPIGRDKGVWRFAIPAGVGTVRLMSRTIRPSAMGPSSDYRRLGVSVRRIAVDSDVVDVRLRLDSPLLDKGMSYVETQGDATWRWTFGDAEIPLGLLARGGEPFVLIIEADCQPLYVAEAERGQGARALAA